jgi:hypothetical protein
MGIRTEKIDVFRLAEFTDYPSNVAVRQGDSRSLHFVGLAVARRLRSG